MYANILSKIRAAIEDECDLLVVCSSTKSVADPILRLYLHATNARKVPLVVAGPGTFRSWLGNAVKTAKKHAETVDGLGAVTTW